LPPVCTSFEDIDYINTKRRTVQIFGGTQVEKHCGNVTGLKVDLLLYS
jgi:hypothetical protein